MGVNRQPEDPDFAPGKAEQLFPDAQASRATPDAEPDQAGTIELLISRIDALLVEQERGRHSQRSSRTLSVHLPVAPVGTTEADDVDDLDEIQQLGNEWILVTDADSGKRQIKRGGSDTRRIVALTLVGAFVTLTGALEIDLIVRGLSVAELLEPLDGIGAMAGIAIGFYFQDRTKPDEESQ
jgi:hypothetical protein